MTTTTEMTGRQRQAASMIEATRRLVPHEDAALPYVVQGNAVRVYTHGGEQFAATVRAFGAGRKEADPQHGIRFVVDLGEGLLPAVVTDISGQVCERVQVGVTCKEITDPDWDVEIPTISVEVPVYELRCPESVLALGATA